MTRSMFRFWMPRPCLVLLLGLCAAVTAAAGELPGDSVYQVAARLTDQDGRVLAWSDLRGRPRVVSMFYGNCHLMCPLIVQSGKSLQKQLAETGEPLDLTLVSLDPARDTPAALSAVARDHRLDLQHWRLLRPQDDDVRSLAAVLDIRYRARPDGSFSHTSALILLDRDGRVLARSEVTGLQPDPRFVAQVRNALATPR